MIRAMVSQGQLIVGLLKEQMKENTSLQTNEQGQMTPALVATLVLALSKPPLAAIRKADREMTFGVDPNDWTIFKNYILDIQMGIKSIPLPVRARGNLFLHEEDRDL